MHRRKMVRLRDACEETENANPTKFDRKIWYIDISSIDNISKRITATQEISSKEAPSRARQKVLKDDILVSTVRPNLNAVAAVEGESAEQFASTGFCVLRPKPEILDPRYLLGFVRSPGFVASMTIQATGASYPAVSSAIVMNEHIPLPPLEEQKRIATILDAVSELILLRKQQLEKLNQLAKSRFIEMFGDLGSDNNGWGLSTLGECCEINPLKSEESRLHNKPDVSFVAMPSVSEDGKMDTSIVRPYNEVKNGYTYFAEGDVLFAKITPCMENGKGAIAENLYNGIGFGSTEFHVIRPLKGLSTSQWIYITTMFNYFRQNAEMQMTGTGGQRRVPASYVKEFCISIPPIELQNHYASFIKAIVKLEASIEKSIQEMDDLIQKLMQKYFE